ncbi:MAG: HEAT repeat domain-containing protein [Caldilineaceae bacterium]
MTNKRNPKEPDDEDELFDLDDELDADQAFGDEEFADDTFAGDMLTDEALDDESWDAAGYSFTRTRLSASELLHRLITDPNTVTGNDLYAFSDLSRQDTEIVRQEWLNIPVERRRTVLRELVDFALNDLDWQLGRILRIALNDTDAQVRQTAIEGLWEDAESDLIGPLIQALRNDEHVGVRAAAATALGAYVLAGELDELEAALAMRVEEALLAVLENSEEPVAIQSHALESIAYSGETGVRQLIEDAYYSPEEEMRVSSLVAMGRSADVHWRGYARAELLNPAPAMRAEAARACGELEAKAALRDLLDLLTDEVPTVRLAAIFALGRIGGRDARDALNALSESGEPAEAEAANEALEEMAFYADPNAISLFDESLDEEDDWDQEPWHNVDEEDLGEYEE